MVLAAFVWSRRRPGEDVVPFKNVRFRWLSCDKRYWALYEGPVFFLETSGGCLGHGYYSACVVVSY
jgi:hypothetical protein